MLELRNVTKTYALDNATAVTPLREVSLRIKSGEFVALAGPSGSGKTTMLNLMAGFVKPTSGQVMIDGKDVQALDEAAISKLRSKKMGFIFQAPSMVPSLSVIENVAVPTMFSWEGSDEGRYKRAAEVLRTVGLGERMRAFPKQLSGGELRRVAIARALMNRPEIIFADEPTGDLDRKNALNIVGTLQAINRMGVTVVMATHDQEMIPYAARALRIERGEVLPLHGARSKHAPAGDPTGPAAFLETAVPSLPSPKFRSLALGAAFVAILLLALAALAQMGNINSTLLSMKSSAQTPGPVSTGIGLPGMQQANLLGRTNAFNPTEYNLYGNTGLYSAAMMGVSWPIKIDPAPGDPFHDPPVLENTATEPGVFEGTLTAGIAPINLGGTVANLMTYNQQYPGPTIKVKRGDTLKIRLVNSLPATSELNVLGYVQGHTNLHTHGLHVSPTEDNVGIDLSPGQAYDYSYNLSLQYPGTLEFLHAHVHGLVSEQLWAGLSATVQVQDDTPALSGYESHIMVLKDISLSGNAPQPEVLLTDYMFGKEGAITTVNGQINPVLSLKPGQVQKWQILNSANARFFRIYLENHLLYVVGTDGGLLDKTYPVSSIVLAPGERVTVLVKGSANAGTFKLLALPYSRTMGMMGMGAALRGVGMIRQTGNATAGTYGMGMMGMDMMDMDMMDLTGMGQMFRPVGPMGNAGMPAGNSSNPATGALVPYGSADFTKPYFLAAGPMMLSNYSPYMMAFGMMPYYANATGNLTTAPWPRGMGYVWNGSAYTLPYMPMYAGMGMTWQMWNAQDYSPPYLPMMSMMGGTLNPYMTNGTSSAYGLSPMVAAAANGTYYPYMMGLPYGPMTNYSYQNAQNYVAFAGMGAMGAAYNPLYNNGMSAGIAPYLYPYAYSSSSMYGDMGVSGFCPGMLGTIGMGAYDLSSAAQVTLMTVTVAGSPASDSLPNAVESGASRLAMDYNSLPQRDLVFSMGMGNAYLNGHDYDVDPLVFKAKVGDYEVWHLINPTMMDHSFHVHTNAFQVLSVMGGDADYAQLYTTMPAWKDTVIIPKMGRVDILLPIMDYSGTMMFHCHILEHEDIGMMGMLDVEGDQPGSGTPM